MVHRRAWFGLTIAGILTALPVRQAIPQELNTTNSAKLGASDTTLLQAQLRTSLRVFTDGQRSYIDQVVVLVAQGKLPRPLVNLVARWAVERNPGLPFPYFQYALRDLAKRRGIKVP